MSRFTGNRKVLRVIQSSWCDLARDSTTTSLVTFATSALVERDHCDNAALRKVWQDGSRDGLLSVGLLCGRSRFLLRGGGSCIDYHDHCSVTGRAGT